MKKADMARLERKLALLRREREDYLPASKCSGVTLGPTRTHRASPCRCDHDRRTTAASRRQIRTSPAFGYLRRHQRRGSSRNVRFTGTGCAA